MAQQYGVGGLTVDGHDDWVHGYGDATYGDAFADVYDEWYSDLAEGEACVELLAQMADQASMVAGGCRVLELGVGTGRLAIPLAARLAGLVGMEGLAGGAQVHGIDASAPMLAQMAAKRGGAAVRGHLGDMAGDLPEGPFTLVFAAYNTLFNLPDEQRQAACIAAVAHRLVPGGRLVVEAFVPADDTPGGATDTVRVRTLAADRVVLAVSRTDPTAQRVEGQYVEFTAAGGVRLRPWSVRWATPGQLDAMAAAAGLTRESRWGGWSGQPFAADSARHVSVYLRPM